MNNSIQDIILEQQLKEVVYGQGWTESSQNQIEYYRKCCRQKVNYHDLSAQYYNWWKICSSVTTTFISTSATLLSGYNTSGGSTNVDIITFIVVFLTNVLIPTISIFDFGGKEQKHISAKQQYSTLGRYIECELVLPIEQRKEIRELFNYISKEFDDIAKNEPIIPHKFKS